MILLEGVNKVYKSEDERLEVLKNVNLHIQENDFFGIMGPSGSGKSSLINLLGFIDTDYFGTYRFKGEEVTSISDNRLSNMRNKNVGFIFQNFKLITEISAEKNVSLPLIYAGLNEKEALKKSRKALDAVGLSDKYKKLPKQLSGGQQQRVSIARALVNEPDFLIADEPTGALDSKTADSILDLFRDLHEQGVTIIMVTHDRKMVKYCTKVMRIQDGRVFAEQSVEMGDEVYDD